MYFLKLLNYKSKVDILIIYKLKYPNLSIIIFPRKKMYLLFQYFLFLHRYLHALNSNFDNNLTNYNYHPVIGYQLQLFNINYLWNIICLYIVSLKIKLTIPFNYMPWCSVIKVYAL